MHHFTARSGIKWHYETFGQGEAILFIHGFGASVRWWANQKAFLDRHYSVIVVDLPGHGGSSWQPVTLQGMAQDLRELLDILEIAHLNIVASSFGGLVAMELYRLNPERVSRISFVGSLPKFARSDSYPAGLDIDNIRKLSHQFEGDYASILDIFFRSLFTVKERGLPSYQKVKDLRATDPLPQREALQSFLKILETTDLRDRLSSLICPVQYITGEEDYLCPRQIMDWIQEHALNARLDFIAGCGHLPFLTKPEEYNELLENFLIN